MNVYPVIVPSLRSIAWCLTALTLELATAAQASELVYEEVAQPFYEPNRGFQIQLATYAAYLDSAFPGSAIRFICATNCILTEGEPTMASNHNVANLLGLRVEVQPNWDSRRWGFRPDSAGYQVEREGSARRGFCFVDSLRVILDVGAADSVLMQQRQAPIDLGGLTVDGLVEATVRCILDNARRS